MHCEEGVLTLVKYKTNKRSDFRLMFFFFHSTSAPVTAFISGQGRGPPHQ